MSWKKYFKTVDASQKQSTFSPLGGSRAGPARANYSSFLPDVYAGAPNRVDRYMQYDTMDMDSEVNAALDILAEFCTQKDKENATPFHVFFKSKPTGTEVKLIKESLQKWCKQQQFETRMFRIFRNALKYGDFFFIRDPETQKLLHVDCVKVSKIIVNESIGKIPEQYVIRDLNFNFKDLVATTPHGTANTSPSGTSSYVSGGSFGRGMVGATAQPPGTRFQNASNEVTVDARHVVHISLSEGLDNNYPFGNSILESVFKVYKQKELLEDAIIIYRIQRAPERRIFYVDVGNMPAHMAMAFVERVKNEIQQRRIPSSTGGGQSMIDASYNPLSSNEDYFFPQTCLALDQKIKLLDNRDLALSEIIKEYSEGKENWVYAVNQQTKEIEPGKIVWAGKTRLDAQLLEVGLDNGEKIKVTPDHKFIMRDGSEVEAQHLKQGDSIMPLYLHDARTDRHQGAGKYLRYTCNATGKKKWVHTMVCSKIQPGKGTEIHHIDFNSLNNNPTNLVEMETQAHRDLHKNIGTYHLSAAWTDPEKRQKLISGIRKYHENATDSDREMFRLRGLENGKNTWSSPQSAARCKIALRQTQKQVAKDKTIEISDQMCSRVVELYNQGFDSIQTICRQLRSDEIFQEEFRKANLNLKRDRNLPPNILPTDKTLRKIAVKMGYDDWQGFKKEYHSNHKVISVIWLEQREDTGDITVESKSRAHNFALSAGVFIHNSEGRGSKVDTLPGGTNLGEITDLRYFTNKLFRALRIPSSYLPTAVEEAPNTIADGKVGTAYIQELRFNEYCKRLQSSIVESFDTEFKYWLSHSGINIDSSVFELKFNSPQNFAAYRQSELDTARVSTFAQLTQIPYLSKRFAMKRFLGMTQEEITENETLWREENGSSLKAPADGAGELRSAGLTPSAMGAEMADQSAEAPVDMAAQAAAPEAEPAAPE